MRAVKNKRILGLLALVALTLGLAGCTVTGTVHMVFEPKDVVKLTIQDMEIYRRWDSWDRSYPFTHDISLRVYVKNSYIGTIPGDRDTIAVSVRTPRYINRSLYFAPSRYQYPPDIRIEVWDHERGSRYGERHVDTLFIPYKAWREGYASGKHIDLHYEVELQRR